MTVDVNNLRCNFVYEVYKLIQRMKYHSEGICFTEAYTAYVQYLLSTYTDCEIPHELLCTLSEVPQFNFDLDCDNIVTVLDCSNQASLTLSYTSEQLTYISKLENSIDSSSFPSITLIPNEVYHLASINLNTSFQNENFSSTTINSGSYEYGGTTYTNAEYNPHVRIHHLLTNVTGIASGYIDKLYVYSTLPTITEVELNLSPLTTPYASFSGSPYTVNTNDLYFGSTQFSIALRQLIENAMYSLFGNKDLGLWKVDVLGTNVIISSAAKHNPTGLWVGLSRNNSKVKYYVNPTIKFVTTPSSNTTVSVVSPVVSKTIVRNTPCSTNNVYVQYNPIMSVNNFETDFNKITLNSNLSTSTATASGTLTSTCNKYILSSQTNSTSVDTTVWTKDSVVISNTDTATTYTTGTYTYTITLNNNCAITDNIIIA